MKVKYVRTAAEEFSFNYKFVALVKYIFSFECQQQTLTVFHCLRCISSSHVTNELRFKDVELVYT